MSGEAHRVFVLLAFDPATRCATRPVAVVGVDARGRAEMSWVPLEHVAALAWADRVAAAGDKLVDAVDEWLRSSNGLTMNIAEVPVPSAADLRGAIEIVMDELLVPSSSIQRSGGR